MHLELFLAFIIDFKLFLTKFLLTILCLTKNSKCMKKISVFLMLLATIGFNAFSQSLNLANWDGKLPVSVAAVTGNVTQSASDPMGGTNHVLEYDRAASTYSSFKLTFDSTKMLKYSQLAISVYSPIASATVRVDLIDNWGDTISKSGTVAAASAWTSIKLNYSGSLTVHPYRTMIVYPDPSAALTETFYFDSVRLMGINANADSSVIALETFGTANCKQTGQSALEPPYLYPSTSFTYGVRVASAHPAGGPVVRGNDQWYAKTLYDSLPKMYPGSKVFTLKNGRWTDIYSFWCSTNASGGTGLSGSYSNSSVDGDITFLAPTGRYSFGWDTLQIDNIDISKFKNIGLSFGAACRDQIKRGIFTYYSVDGGNWQPFCDTSQYINYPTTLKVWKFVSAPKLASNIVGSKMSILFRAMTTNDGARYALDDITLTGTAISIDSIVVPSVDSVVETAQMAAMVYPTNAYDQRITWSVTNGTGSATIDPVTGVLSATALGTVTVTATAVDGGKMGSKVVGIKAINNPFDLTTFTGDVPAGDTIVTINNKQYLKVRVNGYTGFAIKPLIFFQNTTISFSYRYDKDTSTLPTTSAQTFFQFQKSGATYENINITNSPNADTSAKTITQLLRADTVNYFQWAVQNTKESYASIKGPIFVYWSNDIYFTTRFNYNAW